MGRRVLSPGLGTRGPEGIILTRFYGCPALLQLRLEGSGWALVIHWPAELFQWLQFRLVREYFPWAEAMQDCHCEGNSVSKHLSPGSEWCAGEVPKSLI